MSTGIVSKATTGNTDAVAKRPEENYTTVTIYGTYGTVTFTVEASMNGTNFEQVSVIDVKTGLLVAGGTSIAPSDNTARTYAIPLAQNYKSVRVNIGAIASGTPYFLVNSLPMQGSPLYASIAGAAGSFTNVTASGTLGVTGLSTFTGGTIVPDAATMAIGTGADLLLSWDGTRFSFTQAAVNSEMRYGVDGAGIDQMWYGDTASTYMQWDQSADTLIFAGVGGIKNLKSKQTTAVAITGATTLVLADSGGIFTVSQAAAYDIDLPSPTTGAGATYFFSLTAPGANNVTVTVAGSAATFVGSIQIDGATIVATGSTLTFATGAASLGDSISVRSIATNLYHVVCMAAASGGITVA